MSIAGAEIVKDSVEPSFQDLPGPLSSLHFEKIDLGSTPIAFDRIDVHTKDSDSIKLDIDVAWDGGCDIRLRANVIGSFGVRSIKLNGRLSVLMSPLIDKLPLVSAIQVAFINPPQIELDFTGAAQIADLSIIDDTIRSTIHQTLAGMMVLPNRMLTKMDLTSTIFDAYQEPQGIARLTIVGGGGFKVQGRLLNRDIPDVFVKTTLGSSPAWKSSTKSNTTNPVWNESKDFILSDDDQLITVDAYDSDDLSSHDDLGIASITVGDLLLENRMKNLRLKKKGKVTGAHIMVNLSGIYSFVPDLMSFESPEFEGPGALCGLLTILVAQAFNIPVAKEEANVYVKARWGKKEYATAAGGRCGGRRCNQSKLRRAFPLSLDTRAGCNKRRCCLYCNEWNRRDWYCWRSLLDTGRFSGHDCHGQDNRWRQGGDATVSRYSSRTAAIARNGHRGMKVIARDLVRKQFR